jgi:hypothetical protein
MSPVSIPLNSLFGSSLFRPSVNRERLESRKEATGIKAISDYQGPFNTSKSVLVFSYGHFALF